VKSAKISGIVFLVGAGPGDVGLITVRGAKLLEQADVVVYDFLSNPRLLGYCPAAQVIYVGKKASSHSMPQEKINELLIEKAREGKRVVRLKGGDPFVFGRGGEECQALRDAGVAFEIVPGVTAAIGAPAYAGIPVTHRDFNSSFTFVTGHEREDGEEAAQGIAWDALAKLPCVAFYMGVKSLPTICKRLMENGMPGEMPAATIQWGTMPGQRTVVSTLGRLAEDVAAAGLGAPAITIVGKVVELRKALAWVETRPLFGQTIVVTRTRHQISEISQKLEELGADVIEAPTIELNEPADMTEVDAALTRAGDFDWVCFTSANGVTAAGKRLAELGKDARVFGKAKLAAIGSATAAAIESELCLKVDLCPASFVAEALADELVNRNEVAGRQFLLLRADIARPVLRAKLFVHGATNVCDVAIYETRAAKELPPGLFEAIDAGRITWITFSSSSTVKNFLALLGPDYGNRLSRTKLASIGPVTTATLREAGLVPAVEARTFNIDGLIDAIKEGSP
jgi:uroporphyrinogen III methyltransferase / synthase